MTDKASFSRRNLVPWLGLSIAGLLSSCSSEGVQRRTDRRTDALGTVDQNMRIRQSARDERIDRSRDRVLGR